MAQSRRGSGSSTGNRVSRSAKRTSDTSLGSRGRAKKESGASRSVDEVDPADDRRGGLARTTTSRAVELQSEVQLRVPDGPLKARRDPLGGELAEARRLAQEAARPGWMRRLVQDFGWRAYAVPVLALVTVGCLLNFLMGGNSGEDGSPNPTADVAQSSVSSSPTSPKAKPSPSPSNAIQVDGLADFDPSRPSSALPAGAPFASQGSGEFNILAGTSEIFGTGPLRRFTIEAEDGIKKSDAEDFAKKVEAVLRDSRSWTHGNALSFQRVDSGAVDFRISLTSSMTVRKLCGYDQPIETSCYTRQAGRVVINDARWVRGAMGYQGHLDTYRTYVANHEVGHALGHGHMKCPGEGKLAPVMMQQTITLESPGLGHCTPNEWPYPKGEFITGPPTP